MSLARALTQRAAPAPAATTARGELRRPQIHARRTARSLLSASSSAVESAPPETATSTSSPAGASPLPPLAQQQPRERPGSPSRQLALQLMRCSSTLRRLESPRKSRQRPPRRRVDKTP